MHAKSIFSLLKESFKEWQEDEALQLGAALAYYTIFSIAPMLLVVIGIAGLAFGREAVQGQIVGQIQGMVGRDGAGSHPDHDRQRRPSVKKAGCWPPSSPS